MSAHQLIEPLECRRLLAAGDTDLSFSGDGFATVTFPGANFLINDVAIQSNGKVVVAGTKGGNVAVARLNADGSPDTTFGNGGLFESTVGIAAEKVLIQGDDRIVVAVTTGVVYRLMRLTSNGFAEPVFGGGPFVNTGFGTVFGEPIALALQQDQRIIVAGRGGTGANSQFGILRLTTSGSPDPEFGDNGSVEVGFGEHEAATAVAIDYNGTPVTNTLYGTIVVAGHKFDENRIAICRLNIDGSLDETFDSDGRLTSPDLSPNPEEEPIGVLIQPGGKIVVAGNAMSPTAGFDDFLLARYLVDGQLDPSFGDAGTGIVQTDLGSDETARELAPSFGGGFQLSGQGGGVIVATVAAYTRDGLLDARFSGDGWITAPFGGVGAIAVTGETIAPIRRLVVAGLNRVGRYIDVGSVVSIRSFEPNAAEAAQVTATYFVQRTVSIDKTERVYIDVGGTARPPYLLNADYTVSGMTLVHPFQGRSYIEILPNEMIAVAAITPVNDALAEGDETIILSISSDDAYDIGTTASTLLTIVDDEADAVPPTVFNVSINGGAVQRSNLATTVLQFTESTNLASLIAAGTIDDHIKLYNKANPATPIPWLDETHFAWDSEFHRLTIDLTTDGVGGLNTTNLGNGRFELRVSTAGIMDSTGNPLSDNDGAADGQLIVDRSTGAAIQDLFRLGGDLDGDGDVDLSDLGLLATFYGVGDDGDTDGDGDTDLSDLGLLATNYGASLPAGEAQFASSSRSAAGRTSSRIVHRKLGNLTAGYESHLCSSLPSRIVWTLLSMLLIAH